MVEALPEGAPQSIIDHPTVCELEQIWANLGLDDFNAEPKFGDLFYSHALGRLHGCDPKQLRQLVRQIVHDLILEKQSKYSAEVSS